MSRRLSLLGAMALVGVLWAALSAAALAKQRDQLKLTAPGTNTAGEAFPIHMSGFVIGPANTLTYYLSRSSCPVAFHTAQAVGNQPGAELVNHGKRGKRFSVTIEPSETTPGVYHICAYLISGHRTYARATGKTDTQPL